MKTASILLGLLGLALLTGFTVWLGAGSVVHAMLSVGLGGFAVLVAWQVASAAVLALAWRLACPRDAIRAGLARLLLARVLREAGMTCLPFSQLGGILIGMRATASGFGGPRVPWPAAVAASIVDLTAEVIGQIGFVLVGLLLLLDREPATPLAGPVGLGMALGIVAMIAFIWAQRGASGLFRRLSQRLVSSATLRGIDRLQERINRFYARPGRIAGGCLVHLVGWTLGAGWVWIAYRLLGASLPFGAAFAIEGVASGILSVSFLVPAALGVQEAAYVALGSLFGLDPHLSFGLSLLRRGRDLVIGVPMLLLWQGREAWRVRAAQGKGAALDPLGP